MTLSTKLKRAARCHRETGGVFKTEPPSDDARKPEAATVAEPCRAPDSQRDRATSLTYIPFGTVVNSRGTGEDRGPSSPSDPEGFLERTEKQGLGQALFTDSMAESQTGHQLESSIGDPRADQPPLPSESNPVCDSWQQAIQGVLAVVMFLGAVAMVHYYAPRAAQQAPPDDLQKQVHALTAQVEQLKQEQAMPAVVLNRYRNSIGYIYGVYQVGFPNLHPIVRARVSGTGFLVGDGLLATNRHVAEPWYGDSESEELIRHGARATLESLIVFFPGSPTPATLLPASVSKTSDLAILRTSSDAIRGLPILPLAKAPSSPGEHVTVIGYPMGIAGMVAKSPTRIYERLAYRHGDIDAASELAALSLIRPSATWGHLGDVVGDKLIYDAPTAHGGSGGPVFNSKGEVIGVNSAYMDGFSGGTLGVSVDSLRPLLLQAQKPQ
jgi:S1-C subfamily serine protease